jgi:hypothetical protein
MLELRLIRVILNPPIFHITFVNIKRKKAIASGLSDK